MSKKKTIVGVVVLIVVIAGVIWGILFSIGNKLDSDSKEFAVNIANQFINTWDGNILVNNGSPDFLAIINSQPEAVGQVLEIYRALGTVQSVGEFQGEAQTEVGVDGETVTFAQYSAPVTFSNAEANVDVGLVKLDEGWKVQFINVRSPLFEQLQQQAQPQN